MQTILLYQPVDPYKFLIRAPWASSYLDASTIFATMPGARIKPGEDDKSHVRSAISLRAVTDEISAMSISTSGQQSRSDSPASRRKTPYSQVGLTVPNSPDPAPTTLSHQRSDDGVSPFSTRPILLRVGGPQSPSRETQPVHFLVHEKLLTMSSSFFRAALASRRSATEPSHPAASGFVEAQSGTFDLPEDRPDDVRSFLRWLYAGACTEVCSACAVPDPDCPTARINNLLPRSVVPGHDTISRLHRLDIYHRARGALFSTSPLHGDPSLLLPHRCHRRPHPPAFGPLIRFYVLAERYQIGLGLRDLLCDVVAEMAREGNCVPNAQDTARLWRNTMGNNGMRRLVVDLYVGMKTEKLLRREEEEGGGWDGEFLLDLVEGMRREQRHTSEIEGRGTNVTTPTTTMRPGKKEAAGGEGGPGGVHEARVVDEDRPVIRIGVLWRRRCDYHDHHL